MRVASAPPANVGAALPVGIQVGIMPVAALERLTRNAECLLTARERDVISRLKHARRRSESIAGRLVAKWLFLRQMGDVADGRCKETWPPDMHTIVPGELDALPENEYGSLEILPGEGGAPQLVSCEGRRLDMAHVSIAHREGWAAAAVSRSIPVGIDLEVMTPRGQAFHDECISDRERQWLGDAPTAHTEHLATLLWAVKEACFKTGASMATNVWGIGAIDLDIRTAAESVVSSLADRESIRLEPLDVSVTLRAAGLEPQVAYGARGAFALAVMALVRNGMTDT